MVFPLGLVLDCGRICQQRTCEGVHATRQRMYVRFWFLSLREEGGEMDFRASSLDVLCFWKVGHGLEGIAF